jgi:hypothetical protein
MLPPENASVAKLPAAAPANIAGVSSYERELMSLGLGELSPDLFGVAPLAEVRKPQPRAEIQPEAPVLYLDAEPPEPDSSLSADVIAPADEAIDLSALLESLDRAHDDPPAEQELAEFDQFGSVEIGEIDADALGSASLKPEPSGNVVHTEPYADDGPFEAMGLSGGMTDELSALTGADRPSRPVVNVSGIPDPGSGVLRRDQSVDKETLLKIIDGIKNL